VAQVKERSSNLQIRTNIDDNFQIFHSSTTNQSPKTDIVPSIKAK